MDISFQLDSYQTHHTLEKKSTSAGMCRYWPGWNPQSTLQTFAQHFRWRKSSSNGYSMELYVEDLDSNGQGILAKEYFHLKFGDLDCITVEKPKLTGNNHRSK